MSTVSMKTKLPVTADQVWQLVGTFNGLPDWHPGIQSSELEDGGRVRRLKLLGGGEVVETLEKIDDGDRTYSYSIKSSPLPVANYTATLRVHETEDGCEVEWSSDFKPAGAPEPDAMAAIQGVYSAGFENLQKMFGLK